MAKDVDFVPDIAGFYELMNSAGVQEACLKAAENVRDRACAMDGGSYVADVRPGKTRAHAMVKTPDGDFLTMAKQRKHNTLLKALGGKQ